MRQEEKLKRTLGFGEQGAGYERWSLAAPTRCIQAALERMKKAYTPYLKK